MRTKHDELAIGQIKEPRLEFRKIVERTREESTAENALATAH